MGNQRGLHDEEHGTSVKGFTLIASLLILLLLSGISIGLMMMVNSEGKGRRRPEE